MILSFLNKSNHLSCSDPPPLSKFGTVLKLHHAAGLNTFNTAEKGEAGGKTGVETTG